MPYPWFAKYMTRLALPKATELDQLTFWLHFSDFLLMKMGSVGTFFCLDSSLFHSQIAPVLLKNS